MVLPSCSLCALSQLSDKSDPTAEHIARAIRLPSPDLLTKSQRWTVKMGGAGGGIHTFLVDVDGARIRQRVVPFDESYPKPQATKVQVISPN